MKTTFKYGSIAILTLFAAGFSGCSEDKPKEDNSPEAQMGRAIVEFSKKMDEEKAAANARPKTTWQYSEEEDKMTSEKVYYAANISPDDLQFKFPYNGGSTATFHVRNKEKQNEVMLNISKGQFMTSIMEQKALRIRFDDNKPITVNYNGPSDGSHDWIFLSSGKKILSMLKTAKHMIIEVEFYNEGMRQINFDVENFKWEH